MRWLAWLLLAITLAGCARRAEPATVLTLDHADAVATDWQADQPPAQGWTPVTLPDDWTTRWAGHDGVVWYRLRWDQHGTAPLGLLVPYVCLASEMRLNGQLIQRDPQLVEPLSRAWTQPRYFALSPPLLREGRNELLIRVSGLAAYQPGMDVVRVGPPDVLQAQFQRDFLLRHDAQLFNRCVGLVLGGLFGMLWLLSRRAMYGWFALSSLFSAIYGWNFVATSPWPFTSTDAWAAMNIAMYVCGATCLAMFLLRFSERRWPVTEALLLALAGASLVLAAVAPHYLGPQRAPWVLAGTFVYYGAMLLFIAHALRAPFTDRRLLAATFAVQMAVSLHDLAVFFGLVDSRTYLLSLTAPLTLLGTGFVLTYHYAQMLRRVEGFNAELVREVQGATGQLTDMLSREHALALQNTRIAERLGLVRDLHDGFGGTLLGTIAQLEQDDAPRRPAEIAAVLREMRDDLRLIIDTTAHPHEGGMRALLAPLRHRWSQRMEAAGLDMRWEVEALDDLQPSPGTGLDVLRLLQEAISNAFRHSGARTIRVHATRQGDRIHVQVHDDGRGLAPVPGDAPRIGMGLDNMRARAARLGGVLRIESEPGQGTRLAFSFSL
jgi:signal transduction histidine kinase